MRPVCQHCVAQTIRSWSATCKIRGCTEHKNLAEQGQLVKNLCSYCLIICSDPPNVGIFNRLTGIGVSGDCRVKGASAHLLAGCHASQPHTASPDSAILRVRLIPSVHLPEAPRTLAPLCHAPEQISIS